MRRVYYRVFLQRWGTFVRKATRGGAEPQDTEGDAPTPVQRHETLEQVQEPGKGLNGQRARSAL